jgi:hypothetical protein
MGTVPTGKDGVMEMDGTDDCYSMNAFNRIAQ